MARSGLLPASLLARFKFQVALAGLKNGVNLIFTTPTDFLPDTICVYLNGVRLLSGIGNDFVISESGGAGTGYDTVTLASDLAPLAGENLFADYVED